MGSKGGNSASIGVISASISCAVLGCTAIFFRDADRVYHYASYGDHNHHDHELFDLHAKAFADVAPYRCNNLYYCLLCGADDPSGSSEGFLTPKIARFRSHFQRLHSTYNELTVDMCLRDPRCHVEPLFRTNWRCKHSLSNCQSGTLSKPRCQWPKFMSILK